MSSGRMGSVRQVRLKFRTKDFEGEHFHYTGDLFFIYKSGHLIKRRARSVKVRLGPRTLSSVTIVTGNFLHEHIDVLFGVVWGLLLGSFCGLCNVSNSEPQDAG